MAHLVRLVSAELEGIAARIIDVEVDIHVGLCAFTIVGLADKSVSEAKERVNSAIKNSGFKPPSRENRRVTVNLAPADVKKGGSQYDLAIAIGYLRATEQIKEFDEKRIIFAGELSLDGRIRPISGALNIALCAQEGGAAEFLVPEENAKEAAVAEDVSVIPVSCLRDVVRYLEGDLSISPVLFSGMRAVASTAPDIADIKGQSSAKRALTIAAAGGHNLLMVGSPGVGKSYLASALTGILPPLTVDEAIEVTRIYSAAGLNPSGDILCERPFRSPHQTASVAAVVGGGSDPKPGEISLAHNGILFLDELPEFQKNILESLRGPLESGRVTVARARETLVFPAQFTLIAAMNPCPCGYWGDPDVKCTCGMHEVLRYQKRISGPLLDRIDLQIRVTRVAAPDLQSRGNPDTPESPGLREAVVRSRAAQRERFARAGVQIRTNSQMTSRMVDDLVPLSPDASSFLSRLDSRRISPRSFYRLIKTAMTIADIEGDDTVDGGHLAEAFGYRLKEGI